LGVLIIVRALLLDAYGGWNCKLEICCFSWGSWIRCSGLSEFGGVAYSAKREGTWGYTRAETLEDFGARVMDLLSVVRSLTAIAGFCYTQFTDTYQEVNGLLFADRTPKIPLGDIRIAILGPTTEFERQVEWTWRERLMESQRQNVLLAQADYSR